MAAHGSTHSRSTAARAAGLADEPAPQARVAQSRFKQAGPPQQAQSSQVSVTSKMSMCTTALCVGDAVELLKAGPFWSQGAVALVLLVNEDNYLVQLENGQHKINSRLKDLRRKVQTSEQGATARVGVGRWSRHCSPLPSDPPSRSPRDEPGLLSFAEAGREAVPRARPAQPCLEHASRSPRDEPGVDSAQPLPSSAGASPQPSPSSTDAGFSACGGEQLAGHPAWTQPSSLRPGSIAAPQARLPQSCIEQTGSPQHGGFSACGGEQPSPQHVSFSACGGEQPAGQHARTQPNCLGFDEAGGNAAPSVSSAQRCPAGSDQPPGDVLIAYA